MYPHKDEFKFISIANEILEFIKNKELTIGDKLPSVNELHKEFGGSKNTIIRSFRYLNDRKIIKGVRGKGSYLLSYNLHNKEKILCVFNNITDYKNLIFKSFKSDLESQYRIDLTVYNYDYKSFSKIINENISAYDYFVIMPFFQDEEHIQSNLLNTISNISSEKLFLIDKYPSFIPFSTAGVYQDFEGDLFNALNTEKIKLDKYNRLTLIIPDVEFTSPKEIIQGFIRFCKTENFNHRIVKIKNMGREDLKNELFIVLEENDLVAMLKWLERNKITPGKEAGIISYNDHPFKELLNISTFSTNFNFMGKKVGDMISHNQRDIIKNDFHFTDRGSA